MVYNTHVFEVFKDEDLRIGLRRFYFSIISDENIEKPIYIKLPFLNWLSGAGLNMLLLFVEAILQFDRRKKIFIEIFNDEIVDEIFNDDPKQVDDKIRESIYKKIIFYDSMDLISLLRKKNVILYPSKIMYDKIRKSLSAYKAKRFYLYSSRMLSLNALIPNEEEQHALTTRMDTLTTILQKNLFNRIDIADAKEASGQIMFELVKNIYQHSAISEDDQSTARGYACAQITKFPLIRNSNYPDILVSTVLEQIKTKSRKKNWRFLSITINDFGVGIVKKVSKYLSKALEFQDNIQIGRFDFDKSIVLKPDKLLLLAISTEFSTKSFKRSATEHWVEKDKYMRLWPRGYGLIYCLSFISKTFGRIKIISGSVELNIFAKPEAVSKFNKLGNTQDVTKLLDKNFDDYFDYETINLPVESSRFPGTQVIIEIPVEVFTTNY